MVGSCRTIFDEWVRNDVGRFYVQLFDVSLEAWVGMQPSLCVFRETCGEAMIIEHNGDVFSCDHYVYPENRLGNVMESPLLSLASSEQQRKFGQDKLDRLPRSCHECEFRFVCNGECPKHRFASAPNGQPGLNYLCPAYKMFFKHVDPYMKFMAEELHEGRPPANVMRWTREQDLTAAGKTHPNRNDPCICGSGKKYKKCCGGNPGSACTAVTAATMPSGPEIRSGSTISPDFQKKCVESEMVDPERISGPLGIVAASQAGRMRGLSGSFFPTFSPFAQSKGAYSRGYRLCRRIRRPGSGFFSLCTRFTRLFGARGFWSRPFIPRGPGLD